MVEAKRKYLSGAAKIAQYIDRTPRSVYHLFENGKLPGAKKVGGILILDTEAFHAAVFGEAVAA